MVVAEGVSGHVMEGRVYSDNGCILNCPKQEGLIFAHLIDRRLALGASKNITNGLSVLFEALGNALRFVGVFLVRICEGLYEGGIVKHNTLISVVIT